MRVELPLIAGILLAGAFARADAIYLQGGSVLEGSATVDGDKVTIELESGRMSLPRSEVLRIEKGTAPLAEVEQREKKLAKDDLAGMLELASFCRDHALPARERALLERVLAQRPEHAEARRRLGYVREGSKWVLRSEQLRKERLLLQARRDNDLERKRQQVELETAELRRERAEAELRAERMRAQEAERAASPGWSSPVVVAPASRYWNKGWSTRAPLHTQPWSIPGASAPNASPNANFINGARSPESYFDDAYRAAYGHAPAH